MTLAARSNGHPVPAPRPSWADEHDDYVVPRSDLELVAILPHGALRSAVEALPVHSAQKYTQSVVNEIDSYTWHCTDKFDLAMSWCKGMCAARKDEEVSFFAEAMVDLYHSDRALRAKDLNNLKTFPLREESVPTTLRDSGITYNLQHQSFHWTTKTPAHVVTKAAEVLQTTPPDHFWIAEYIEQRQCYDPVLYANFGSWCVEVIRWL